MSVLNQEQIAERIALYQRYNEAITKLAQTTSQMPEAAPDDFIVACEGMEYNALNRTLFVIRRAWPSLRKAVLADAEKELADAEQAVLKFETGEEVNASE